MRHFVHHILIAVLLLVSGSVYAQRHINELESNYDDSMGLRTDTTSSGGAGVVPVDVYSWTIDEKYGSIRPQDVDTLTHGFQNADLPEGPAQWHFSTLGNVGSPRMSRVFMLRKPMSPFLFVDPFDMFVIGTERVRFYNTKSPYLNLTYNWGGSKNTGSDHVKVTYTNNAGKLVNFGGIFDYVYGRGYYDHQATSFMNASAWASYLGERYKFHFCFQHNYMKMAENGGIEDEGYITHPEEMPGTYSTNDIPTRLSNLWNSQEHNMAFFTHHYNIGFYRDVQTDSASTVQEFVPVSRVFHTVKFNDMYRNLIIERETNRYHSFTYLPFNGISDRATQQSVKNLVGVSMCEGFNKWAVFGLNVYAGYEYNRYSLPDTTAMPGLATVYGHTDIKEHNVLIGGQLLRQQGKFINYDIDAEFVVAGESIGQFDVRGHGEANIPLLGDTARVEVNAYVKNLTPSYFFRHFHSTHAWWDNSTGKEFRQRVEGVVTLPHTHTSLTVGVENVKNYCYFQNDGTVLTTSGGRATITNNISARQLPGSVQVFTARLKQDLALGILHFDNDIVYQACTNTEVLPLPALTTYHNLYLKFKIAKVLNTEVGGDMKYFTEYYAPDYSPVMGQFMNQHRDNRVDIGNYPIVSAYANFLLKRARFYVRYNHANQSDGRAFWAPCYPINPAGVHFGLSWNFYD